MKKTDKKWVKATALVLTVTLVGGGTGIWTCARMRAEAAQKETAQAEAQVQENSTARVTKEVELSEADKEKLSKEETVYVIANADGSTQKLIVSDWLKNALKEQKISDTTELTEISNVKGEESFAKENGNTGVWDAQGNDIYYQGNIEKELPVEMKISYTLDGQEISPEELAGKSGKVTIRFDYTNRQKETVLVDGKEEELYVPFVLLTGMFVDNEKFANIEVSNGKTINDGERTVIMGYAMPGLKDNLEIESEDLNLDDIDLPDYVEVTADVTDFELAATLTIATNEIFGDLDVELDDKMDDLSSDMTDLQDAMQELMDGTSDLYDGVLELVDGTDELTDGINELNDGARDLRDGAGDLYDGTKSLNSGVGTLKSGAGQLIAGMQKLSGGLSELDGNSPALTAGVKALQQGILGSLNAKIQEVNPALSALGVQLQPIAAETYAEDIETDIVILTQVIQGLDGQIAQVKARLNQALLAQGQVQEQIQEQGQPQVQSQSQAQAEEQLQPETFQSLPESQETTETPDVTEGQEAAGISGAAESQEDVRTQASVQENQVPMVQTAPGTGTSLVDALLQLQSSKTGLETLKETMASMKTMLDGIAQLSAGLTTYTGGVKEASKGARQIMQNVPALNSGINSLSDGAGKLQKGAGDLYDGTKELKDGTSELKDGGQELKDGVQELKDGALELKDGTVEFNDEGIQKLVELLDGDLPELVDRFDGSRSAAQAYKSFAGISDDMDGQVRFIYKTAAIEK